MKGIKILIPIIFIAQFTNSQSAERFYKKGDSLNKLKEYKNAASAYSEGIKTEGKDADLSRYWMAAKAWSQANIADSAFYLINLMANSDKISPSDANRIENENELKNLHYDKRWNGLIRKTTEKASKNYNIEELIYGRKDGIALTMFHLKPRTKPNSKVVLWVMAGNWVSSYQQAERSVRPSAMYLDKGFTVFLVILGSQPRYAIPDEIEDVKRAVRYIRYNAAKLKVDPNKIGIYGGSAGGNLSLSVALADEKIDMEAQDPINRISSRVQAAAVLYPPTDCLNWGFAGANMINMGDLLKGSGVYGAFDFRVWNNKTRTLDFVTDTSIRNKIGREISPIYSVTSDDPPVFIIHGDADKTVPIQQSKTFIDKLNEAGVVNKFIIKKGGDHNPMDMMPEMNQFVDWFEKYLK